MTGGSITCTSGAYVVVACTKITCAINEAVASNACVAVRTTHPIKHCLWG